MRDNADGPWQHRAVFSAAVLESRYPEPEKRPHASHLVFVRENGVYVWTGVLSGVVFPDDTECYGTPLREQYLGHLDNRPFYAVEVPPDFSVFGGRYFPNVRDLYGQVSECELALAAFAVCIIDFDRTTTFCGQCGAKTRQSRIERAKVCDHCGLVTYPRTSPAIIVLVRNQNRILLARSPRFPPDLFSLIAGFVEPGENLEEAVCREVMEEVGIRITNIRYAASEPWPFPHSLMVGFTADYAGGEIVTDNNEIVAADWFDRGHLPILPSPVSLSRALIDFWIKECDSGGNP